MVTIRVIPAIDFESERFWSKVNKTDYCWLWTRSLSSDGYGRFGVEGEPGESMGAHRRAWERATGETLTSHDTICHTCDTPSCVREDDIGTYAVGGSVYPRRGHLYKATQPVNVADRDEKGRGNWAHGEQNGTHTHPESLRRGERNPWAALTSAGVISIRERYAAGENASALAKEFGLADHTVIFSILTRKTWAHVPGLSYEEIKQARARAKPNLNNGPCLDCGTTERKRIAKGLCEHCYSERKRRTRGIQPQIGISHPQAKLTDADVLAIRAAPMSTTGVELARRYAVSTGCISTIRSGKSWTHLI